MQASSGQNTVSCAHDYEHSVHSLQHGSLLRSVSLQWLEMLAVMDLLRTMICSYSAAAPTSWTGICVNAIVTGQEVCWNELRLLSLLSICRVWSTLMGHRGSGGLCGASVKDSVGQGKEWQVVDAMGTGPNRRLALPGHVS